MGKQLIRANKLISILKEKNGATVKELAAILDVSEMTIRRDLRDLNSKQIINSVYGAAIYNPSNLYEKPLSDYSLLIDKVKNDSQKNRIGKYAASLIKENDLIIIDSGSTTEELAANIDNSVTVTILCYNLNILNTLTTKENTKLIFPGGYFHPNTQMFESQESISLINNIRATKVFVSSAGVHEKLGITCANNYEAPTKKVILSSAAERILLADSSKFGQIRSTYFADLLDFHKIITDSRLSITWINYIKSLGIELIIV